MFHVEHLRLLECEAKKNLVTLFHVEQDSNLLLAHWSGRRF